VKPVLSLQVPGSSARYEHFFRMELEDTRLETLQAAVAEIKDHPKKYAIGKAKQDPFSKRRARKALKPDEEQLPGVEVDAAVEKALIRA
jgi:hypothetical protein